MINSKRWLRELILTKCAGKNGSKTYALQLNINGKRDGFWGARIANPRQRVNIMREVDPANASKYEKILVPR